MKSGSISMLLLCFLSLSTIIFARHATDEFADIEVGNQTDFDYSLASSIGPDHWGSIHAEWSECNHGHMQSPIDIREEAVTIVPSKGDLLINYKPSTAKLSNRGHDIMVEWLSDAGSMQINGTNYKLKQSHWHSPSEHSINGQRFALEQHLVHLETDPTSGAPRKAVLGILYDVGASDTFLSQLEQHMYGISEKGVAIHAGLLDATKIKINKDEYYRYIGSLTTPTCAEGVIWTIHKEVKSVSDKQVTLLRAAIHDIAKHNSRPTQPLNGREIRLYKLEGSSS